VAWRSLGLNISHVARNGTATATRQGAVRKPKHRLEILKRAYAPLPRVSLNDFLV
jgi:hypothetical protein